MASEGEMDLSVEGETVSSIEEEIAFSVERETISSVKEEIVSSIEEEIVSSVDPGTVSKEIEIGNDLQSTHDCTADYAVKGKKMIYFPINYYPTGDNLQRKPLATYKQRGSKISSEKSVLDSTKGKSIPKKKSVIFQKKNILCFLLLAISVAAIAYLYSRSDPNSPLVNLRYKFQDLFIKSTGNDNNGSIPASNETKIDGAKVLSNLEIKNPESVVDENNPLDGNLQDIGEKIPAAPLNAGPTASNETKIDGAKVLSNLEIKNPESVVDENNPLDGSLQDKGENTPAAPLNAGPTAELGNEKEL